MGSSFFSCKRVIDTYIARFLSPRRFAASRIPASGSATAARVPNQDEGSSVRLERVGSAVGHSSAMNGTYLRPDEGERIRAVPRHHRVFAELPQLEVIDARFGPGFAVEPHKA
jgi:hypothetical protein